MNWLWSVLIVQCMVLWFAGHATALCVASGDEEIFAHFFDIALDASPGDEVTGRLHPKSNKEFSASTYEFSLLDDADGMFNVMGRRDYWGPMYGVLSYTGAAPLALGAYNVTAELRIDGVIRGCVGFAVQCSNETLMQRMLPRLIDHASGEPRLWGKSGKHKPSEMEVEAWIGELEANDGQLRDPATQTVYAFYNNTPWQRQIDKGFTDDWSAAIKVMGNLGYAYHTDAVYTANATRRHALKQAMYLGLEALARSLPLFHTDVMDADGRPVGADFGDGLANCKAIEGNDKTHQWVFTDPLCLPALLLVGDIMRESAQNDTRAQRLHAGLVYLFQPPFTLLVNRRMISGPGHRWDDLVELDHVNGAWADANRGHRYRGMVTMLGIWHDYNRPITYVPYWYADYDFKAAGLTAAPGDAVPAGFSLLPGWSPSGILPDLAYWFKTTYVDAYLYGQSGFYPDGLICHHKHTKLGPYNAVSGHRPACDIAGKAYGFEWVAENVAMMHLGRGTPLYDVEVIRRSRELLIFTFSRVVYKSWLDWTITGRSFENNNLRIFGSSSLRRTADTVLELAPDTELAGYVAALDPYTHEFSGNVPFWNFDYMVHRRGAAGEAPHFFSVRMRSTRTVGPEDYGDPHKSWHGGSGLLQLLIDGDEYDQV